MWHFNRKFLSERFQIRWTVNIQSKSNATPLLQNEKSDILVCFVQKQRRTMCQKCSVAIIFVKTSALNLIPSALFVWWLQVAPPLPPKLLAFLSRFSLRLPEASAPAGPSVRPSAKTAKRGCVKVNCAPGAGTQRGRRSASGSSNSIGTKLLQLVKQTEQIFWFNLCQD